jgi:hypothetical protein
VDGTAVVCWPVARPGRVVTGSTRGACSECGAAVWISPTSRPIIAEHAAVIICVACFEKAQAARTLKVNPPTPAQLGEMARELLRPDD